MLIASSADGTTRVSRGSAAPSPRSRVVAAQPDPIASPPVAGEDSAGDAVTAEGTPRRTVTWSGIVHVKAPSPPLVGGTCASSLALATASKGWGGSLFII